MCGNVKNTTLLIDGKLVDLDAYGFYYDDDDGGEDQYEVDVSRVQKILGHYKSEPRNLSTLTGKTEDCIRSLHLL